MQLSRDYAVTRRKYNNVHDKVAKLKSQCAYQPAYLSWECVRLIIQRLLVRAHCVPLFFFQQCSLVGIKVFTCEDPRSE